MSNPNPFRFYSVFENKLPSETIISNFIVVLLYQILQKKESPYTYFFKFGLTLSINQLQPFFVFLNIDTFDNRHTQHVEDNNSKQQNKVQSI